MAREMMTRWKCPECDMQVEVEAYELATIGNPRCTECDIEMESNAPESEILSRDQLITQLTADLLNADTNDLVGLWFQFYDGDIQPLGDDKFEITPVED